MVIYGRNLSYKTDVGTNEDCSQMCLENINCIAFAYTKSTRMCFLKNTVTLTFYGTGGILEDTNYSSGVRCDRSFPGFPADRTYPAAAAEITNGEFTNGKIRNVKSFCSIRLKIFSLDTFHLKCKFDLKNYFRT